MKLSVEIDTAENPNLSGEILRGLCFDQTKGLGCYETFEHPPSVKRLYVIYDRDLDKDIFCAEFWVGECCVEAQWYWEGDGTLEFIFEDGSSLVNYDCKKTHKWKYIS